MNKIWERGNKIYEIALFQLWSMKKLDTIVYITSVIYFKEKPLSYSTIRSAFSPQERLQQTIRTIESVRQHIPNAYIVLIESGMQWEWLMNIRRRVDDFVYIGDKKIIRKFVDSSYKWAWELISILYTVRLKRNVSKEYIIKISWRYWINEQFDIAVFFEKYKLSFHKSTSSNGISWYSTRLYNLHKSNKMYWIMVMSLGLFISFFNISIENIFYYFLPSYRISEKKVLWISWYSGVDKVIITE
jgi:hypothetical protein